MKCLKCRFSIPNDAEVCGHCGHPTDEQRKHQRKFAWTIVVVVIPVSMLMGWLFQDMNFPWWSVPLALAIFIAVFKFVFKGEFSKTGYF